MYNLILLDADGTLFDYDKAEESALTKALKYIGFEDNLNDIRKSYRIINASLWKELELGTISKDKLKFERFNRLFKEFSIVFNANEFSSYYLDRLGEGIYLLDGAEEMCKELSKNHRLVILTNGIKEVQLSRLKDSSIKKYINDIVISDEVGVSKPDPYIFEHTLNVLNHPNKSDVLMVGDSLTSDIKGGLNFGIDTCWYNPDNLDNISGIEPKYMITSLKDIHKILGVKYKKNY
jgi:YjjG family noncanonical pyrimidine nucleotidase